MFEPVKLQEGRGLTAPALLDTLVAAPASGGRAKLAALLVPRGWLLAAFRGVG